MQETLGAEDFSGLLLKLVYVAVLCLQTRWTSRNYKVYQDFKSRLEKTLSNLILVEDALPMAEGLDLKMSLYPNHSVILQKATIPP